MAQSVLPERKLVRRSMLMSEFAPTDIAEVLSPASLLPVMVMVLPVGTKVHFHVVETQVAVITSGFTP